MRLFYQFLKKIKILDFFWDFLEGFFWRDFLGGKIRGSFEKGSNKGNLPDLSWAIMFWFFSP